MECNKDDHSFTTSILAFQNKDTKKGPIEPSSVMLAAQQFVILILNCQWTIC